MSLINPESELREVGHGTMVLVVLAVFGLSAFTAPILSWFGIDATSQHQTGLIQTSLIVGLIDSALVIGGLILWQGKLRLSDLGLTKSKILLGFKVSILVWVLIQLCLFLDATFHTSVELALPSMDVVGVFMGNLTIAGFFEEVGFRGFLLVQLFLYLRRVRSNLESTRLTWIWAVLVSSLVFGAMHIPNAVIYLDISAGALILKLILTTALGALFAGIYLKTGNLVTVVGIHTMVNAPISIVHGASMSALIYLLVVVASMMLFWKPIRQLLT